MITFKKLIISVKFANKKNNKKITVYKRIVLTEKEKKNELYYYLDIFSPSKISGSRILLLLNSASSK